MSTPGGLRILFVDDEPKILDGLRRQLRPMRDQWDTRFAGSGAEALSLLEQQPADVVVSDMRMPGMTGVELLAQVHQRWPGVVRIVLSGQTDQADLLADIGVIHQFLQKPCDTETLRQSIVRTTGLARSIECEALRKMVTGLKSLPVLARSLRELTDAMDSRDSDMGVISEIVGRDVGLSAKLLQLVNSAFFGMPRRVSQVREAISLIGLKSLKEVAVAAHAFDAMASDGPDRAKIERLWTISSDLAGAAGAAARKAGAGQDAESRARLTASLSLVGRAVFIRYAPDLHAIAMAMAEEGKPLEVAEQAAIGVSHQVVGAYVLGLWAFDDEIVAAVSHQGDANAPEGLAPTHPLHFLRAARQAVPAEQLHERYCPFGEAISAMTSEAGVAA